MFVRQDRSPLPSYAGDKHTSDKPRKNVFFLWIVSNRRRIGFLFFILAIVYVFFNSLINFFSALSDFEAKKDGIYDIYSYNVGPTVYRTSIPGLIYPDDASSIDHTLFLNGTSAKNSMHIVQPALYSIKDLLTNWRPNDVSFDKWQTSLAYPTRNSVDNRSNVKLSVTGKGNSININLSGLSSSSDVDMDGVFNKKKGIKKGKGGLMRFNYLNENDRLVAQLFRAAEIPFVLYNAIDNDVVEAYSIGNLLSKFGSLPLAMERSKDYNKFMYYTMNKKNPLGYSDWTPPQTDVIMTFADFLNIVEKNEKIYPDSSKRPLHYFTISAKEGYETPWIRNAWKKLFSHKNESLLIVEPDSFNGINCRFGMKGVIAAAHYDGHRNFLGIVRGRKRIILLPPSECKNLSLHPKGHPSARHSSFDWSDINVFNDNKSFGKSQATEYVLAAGEMMYIPPYWFHYIISQDATISCNSRSGTTTINKSHIENCGINSDPKKNNKGKSVNSTTHLDAKKKQNKINWNFES